RFVTGRNRRAARHRAEHGGKTHRQGARALQRAHGAGPAPRCRQGSGAVMSVTEFPDLERAREDAANWVARLDRALPPQERAELRQWCAGRPANARALRQMTGLWADLGVMKALADVFPEGLEQAGTADPARPAIAEPMPGAASGS